MIYPSVEKLLETADSRFELIVAASKRARVLFEGAESKYDVNEMKAVSIAVRELDEGIIEIIKPVEGEVGASAIKEEVIEAEETEVEEETTEDETIEDETEE